MAAVVLFVACHKRTFPSSNNLDIQAGWNFRKCSLLTTNTISADRPRPPSHYQVRVVLVLVLLVRVILVCVIQVLVFLVHVSQFFVLQVRALLGQRFTSPAPSFHWPSLLFTCHGKSINPNGESCSNESEQTTCPGSQRMTFQPPDIYFFFYLPFYLAHSISVNLKVTVMSYSLFHFSHQCICLDYFAMRVSHSSVTLANASVQMLLNTAGRNSTLVLIWRFI